MTDTPGLVRHLLLLQMLSVSRRGVTLREMADETGSSQRTITRDLNTMRQAGLPVVSQVEAHGRKTWQLDFDSDANRPVFTFDELAALYLGRRLLDPLIGTWFQDGARRALQKIRAALPESARKFLEKLVELVRRSGAIGRSPHPVCGTGRPLCGGKPLARQPGTDNQPRRFRHCHLHARCAGRGAVVGAVLRPPR